MWFVHEVPAGGDGPLLRMWTYARSQKAMNRRRVPQATALVEARARYSQLGGASFECDVEILDHDDPTLAVGLALIDRYAEQYEQDRAAMVAAFERQARKRVGLVLTPTRVVTWDHRKLAG